MLQLARKKIIRFIKYSIFIEFIKYFLIFCFWYVYTKYINPYMYQTLKDSKTCHMQRRQYKTICNQKAAH